MPPSSVSIDLFSSKGNDTFADTWWRNVRSSWRILVELFSPSSLHPHRGKMQYLNLAKGSQPNANAYDQLAKSSTNRMQAALAAMGWAALCPSSMLPFFKQRETLWEPDTGFQDKHWESWRWLVTHKTAATTKQKGYGSPWKQRH